MHHDNAEKRALLSETVPISLSVCLSPSLLVHLFLRTRGNYGGQVRRISKVSVSSSELYPSFICLIFFCQNLTECSIRCYSQMNARNATFSDFQLIIKPVSHMVLGKSGQTFVP